MLLHTLLFIHVCTITTGLISGFLAMFLRKGPGGHGAAGAVFAVAMLTSGISAGYVAAFLRPVPINVVVSMLTCYLVTTGWWAAKRRTGGTNRLDVAALVFALFVAAGAFACGIHAAASTTPSKDGVPVVMYFVFGVATLLLAMGDVRMLMTNGVAGARRIGRHLWRMSFTLIIATFSLYPGQARLFSKEVRATNLQWVPHVILVGMVVFWLVRIGARKRAERKRAAAAVRPFQPASTSASAAA